MNITLNLKYKSLSDEDEKDNHDCDYPQYSTHLASYGQITSVSIFNISSLLLV